MLRTECNHPKAKKCINCLENGDCKVFNPRNTDDRYCSFFKTKEEYDKIENAILTADNGFYKWYREFLVKCKEYDRKRGFDIDDE